MSFRTECERVNLDPDDVLKGPLSNAFKDAYATLFMDEIYNIFWAKAQGDPDRFGKSWAKLEASTIAIKQQMADEVPGEESEYQKHNLKGKNGVINYTVTSVPQIQGLYSHRKLLSPEQLKVFKRHATGNHRTNANNRGLNSVKHSVDKDKAELINIRSGRLAAALAPVTASRGRLYQSGPDATYSWGTYYNYPALMIELSVPYADEVHNGSETVPPRPVLPTVAETRIIRIDAIKAGVQAARRIQDQLERGRL